MHTHAQMQIPGVKISLFVGDSYRYCISYRSIVKPLVVDHNSICFFHILRRPRSVHSLFPAKCECSDVNLAAAPDTGGLLPLFQGSLALSELVSGAGSRGVAQILVWVPLQHSAFVSFFELTRFRTWLNP